jgi:nucleotide-binding universal stress UspA family protein
VTGFDRILVPLDGSQRAESALRWVHLLPTREVRLFRVCAAENGDRADALRYLDEVAARLRLTGSAVDTHVAHGEPADAIVSAAEECDMIVMSTQGAGGGGRLLYGSVADRVARHASAPTLLARGGVLPIELAPLRRVVVPLDGSPAAERALPLATTLSRILHARLHLITVDELASGASDDEAQKPVPATGADRGSLGSYLEGRAAALRAEGVSLTTEHSQGEPATELIARVIPGDLLVLTAHGRGAAQRWQIGTVAERLLRQAPAPLVLLRAGGS